MSLNNTSILYAGIDVAKATFQLAWQGASHCLPNDAKGHARLRRLLGEPGRCHVVMEASGGYEQRLAQALWAGGYTLSIVEPGRVKGHARAHGQRAKTDALDAALIQSFGAAVRPAPTPAPTPQQLHLTAVVKRRAQLLELKVAARNHTEHYTDAFVQRQATALLKTLTTQITRCEAEIAKLLAADPLWQTRAARVQQVPGVGPVVAAALQAYLPKLGSIRSETAVALAGLAPYANDSGPRSGPRHIQGGRKALRCTLYMAALSAVRHDAIFKAFYTRLCSAGKPPLVALTAVMRKLLRLLNLLLKNPSFQLSTSPS
jgi:transposase